MVLEKYENNKETRSVKNDYEIGERDKLERRMAHRMNFLRRVKKLVDENKM